jgi:hypothetical protein
MHGMPRPQDLTQTPVDLNGVHDLHTAAKKALGTVDQAAAVRHVPANNRQARLKTYVDAVVDQAPHLVADSWTERVGGFDILLKGNLSAGLCGKRRCLCPAWADRGAPARATT